LPDFPGKELMMMRKVLRIMAVALAFYFIPSAQADTDFTLDLTTENGTPASGTVTVIETSSTSVQFEGYALPLQLGTPAQAATILAGCSTCSWIFETGGGLDPALLYLFDGSLFARFGCFECASIDLYQSGNYTSPIPVHIGTGRLFPCHNGHDRRRLLGDLKRKFLTKRVVEASREFIQLGKDSGTNSSLILLAI
jgi:hypothetical protein